MERLDASDHGAVAAVSPSSRSRTRGFRRSAEIVKARHQDALPTSGNLVVQFSSEQAHRPTTGESGECNVTDNPRPSTFERVEHDAMLSTCVSLGNMKEKMEPWLKKVRKQRLNIAMCSQSEAVRRAPGKQGNCQRGGFRPNMADDTVTADPCNQPAMARQPLKAGTTSNSQGKHRKGMNSQPPSYADDACGVRVAAGLKS